MKNHCRSKWKNGIGAAVFAILMGKSTAVQALEVDWSGQFWSEFNLIHHYNMSSSEGSLSNDATRLGQGGYYIPSGGAHDATFQSLFLRLKPKVVVNDNVLIKSEWWVGDPLYGMFGNSLPWGQDQTQHYSTFSRGSLLSAQRFWAEMISDFGTFQVGRVPLHWGLGVVWNSGDALWSRYMSTADAVRWIAKFGSFTFAPSVLVPTIGNSVGGTCTVSQQAVTNGVVNPPSCTPGVGLGGVVDYSFIFKYESMEEDFEGGVNLIKRLGGASQDPGSTLLGNQRPSRNTITYDLYAKKKFNQFSLAGELPLGSGEVGGVSYRGVGFAGELGWNPSESFQLQAKFGYASGQATANADGSLGSYHSFYFHPNYHVGMILFNYQLANLAGPQTQNHRNAPGLSQNALASVYDNPIVNAQYIALSTQYKANQQWTIRPSVIYAIAPQVAKAGQPFFNYWQRSVTTNNTSTQDQSKSLGLEFDLGVSFQWDDHFVVSWDNGLYLPGKFYAYSATPTENETSAVFASSLRLGVSF